MSEFSEKMRIVVKVGTHLLTHEETGKLNYVRIEKLVRELCDLKNKGKDVCLVTSGAVAAGRQSVGVYDKNISLSAKQALASVGQARLMGMYQKIFSEYNQTSGQVLMTKDTILNPEARKNAKNTFEELFNIGVIPVVNANDTISTFELKFDENDTLSALVATLIGADLLIILTDIDGLYSSDPKSDPFAKLISRISKITDEMMDLATDRPGSDVGSGGMKSKVRAAQISTAVGTQMIVANGSDMSILNQIFEGEFRGSIFDVNKNTDFDVLEFIRED